MDERRPELTRTLLAVLGFMTAVGPFATDLYLPSLPQIGDELGTTPAGVQLTLTAFLAGMAVGQLVFGPLSDRFGRRRVVVIALGLFAASSIALVFSPTIEWLVALRLVQGVTGAAGVVVARAVAADLSRGTTAVRALSLMATVSSVGILAAPLVGGVMARFTDWRGALSVLAAITVVQFLLALVRVPESLPADRRHTGGLGDVFRTMGGLLRDHAFVGFLLAYAFGFATMMAYISGSSFVVQSVLGLDPLAYSLAFAVGAVAMLVVNSLNARLAPRVGPMRMLVCGVGALALAVVSLTVQSTTGTLTVVGFVASAVFVTGGTGLILSNTTALALALAPQSRGTASALLGFVQFLAGASVSPLVGLGGEHTAVPMALTMVGAVAVAVFGLLLARRP